MKIFYDGREIMSVGGFITLNDATATAANWIEEDFDAEKVARVPEDDRETRSLIREAIAVNAGDTHSLLGTTSDSAQLLLYHMAKLTQGLAAANSLAEVRDATAAFAPMAEAFLIKVEAGEVKLPFQFKGEAEVMAEIEARATAVTTALSTEQGG